MNVSRSFLARVTVSLVVLVGAVSAETVGANVSGLPLPTSLGSAAGVLLVLLGLTLAVQMLDRFVPIAGSGRFWLWYGLAAGIWFFTRTDSSFFTRPRRGSFRSGSC